MRFKLLDFFENTLMSFGRIVVAKKLNQFVDT
jgi:hypothetical protein